MPVPLTPEQIAELERSGDSLFVVENPQTRQGYVLVPTDAYLQAKPLFEAIIGRTRGSVSLSAQDQLGPVEWNDAKNARRCALIDKKHDVGLLPAEETELDRLQAELAAQQRLVTPRPLAILELLEEALRPRAANCVGRV
jgi:hypothetical protein